MKLHYLALLIAANIGMAVYNFQSMQTQGFFFGINVLAVVICLVAYHKVRGEQQERRKNDK